MERGYLGENLEHQREKRQGDGQEPDEYRSQQVPHSIPSNICLSVCLLSLYLRGGGEGERERESLTLKYILPGMVISGTFLPVCRIKAGLDKRLATAGRTSEPSALPTEATHSWHLSHLVLE